MDRSTSRLTGNNAREGGQNSSYGREMRTISTPIVEVSKRAKFFATNTMLCLLKALENKQIYVELRNDIVVSGILSHVGFDMDLFLTEVTYRTVKGHKTKFDQFYVRCRQIISIPIPDEVDIQKAMVYQLYRNDFQKYQSIKKKEQLQKHIQKKSAQRMAQDKPT